MEKKLVLGALFVAGCATSGDATKSSTLPQPSVCIIAEPQKWKSSPDGFSRSATLDAIGSFEEAAKADREQMRGGAGGEVGHKLDELYTSYVPPSFISSDVMQLGVRLRQLDCAVRGGQLKANTADHIYDQILAELAVERSIFEPGAGKPRTAAP